MRSFAKPLFVFVFFFLLNILLVNKIHPEGGFYVCNKGISFGINLNPWIFWLIFAFFIVFIIIAIYKNKHKKRTLFLHLFLIGVLLNVFDRLFYGCVVDYFYLNFSGLPFFNLGDTLITVSAILLIHNLFTDNT